MISSTYDHAFSVPDWYALLLLGLGAYRVWRLLPEDTLLEALRSRLMREDGWLEELVECPWCLGFWIAVCFWAGYQLWPHAMLVVSVPLALSVVVGALGSKL